jgi:serine phosphatase RsbU (regulator of sigma subunit)
VSPVGSQYLLKVAESSSAAFSLDHATFVFANVAVRVSGFQVEISSGDTLALYADGITESSDDAGDEFGEWRLIEA